MKFVLRIKDFILDLIFPRECLVCGQEGSYLCSACLDKVNLNKKFYCCICKTETIHSELCQKCREQYFLKAIWVAADYNDKTLQMLIHFLKYKYIEETAGILAKIMEKYLEQNQIFKIFELDENSAIFVPVPLHKKRLLSRGFNQSDLLAKKLSEFYGIQKEKILLRRKSTQSQIDLKRSERLENVKEAFGLVNQDKLDKNKKVILIDDVVTTGSTLNECAKTLKRAGFDEIYGLVIAQRED